ncbi:SMI1/KNR4 family protein [Amycolatopsis suaedae]|uniref:SMI1/KNR4 family protein n=1 Tax=Amycolatopsis suaedae TaxID=2510978 RepID=UPI0030B864F6
MRTVLTAGPAEVDGEIAHWALLLAGSGYAADCDRLVRAWLTTTGRSVTALADGPLRARAWAMLFDARGQRPGWADPLPPLDLRAEQERHRAHLARPPDETPAARLLSGPSRPDPARAAVAEADRFAVAGRTEQAVDCLRRWAAVRSRPDFTLPAGCRPLAGLLAGGANPLDLSADEAARCTGDLVAALHRRYPAPAVDWPELIHRIAELRELDLPEPASERALAEASARIGRPLPADYLTFLRTCDGLPGDEVFPRLLSAAELRPSPGGVIEIAERVNGTVLALAGERWVVVEVDPVLGTTTHPGFRALLERHLALLER